MKLLIISLASIVILAKQAAIAQTEQNVVVVTGTRTPQVISDSPVAIEIISPKEISQSAAHNAADLLEHASGTDVEPQIQGRGASVQLQGLSSKHVLVLIDGQRPPSGIGEGFDLRRIPVSMISHIEIIEGAGSVLYGSDAMGGVINIISKKPKNGWGGLAHTEASSLGARYGFGQIYGGNDTLKARMLFGRNWEPSFALDSTPDVSAKIGENNLGLHLIYEPSSYFSVASFYLREDQQRAKKLAYSEQNSDTISETILIAPVYSPNSQQFLKFSFGLSQASDRYQEIIEVGQGKLKKIEDSNEKSRDGSVIFSQKWSVEHRSEAGVDHRLISLESDRVREAKIWRRNYAAFLQHHFTPNYFSEKFGIVPGVRFETDSQFGGNLSKSLALRYKLENDIVLRFNYGEGFRAPSFKNLAVSFENPGVGYVVEGNPNLKPEKSKNYIFSVSKLWQQSLWAEFSLFHNQLVDLIDIQSESAQGQSQPIRYSYKNTGRAFTRGAKLAGRCNAWRFWRFGLDYNFLEAKDEILNRNLDGRSKHALGSQIGIDTGGTVGFTAQLGLKWKDKKTYHLRSFVGEEEQNILPASTNIDFKISQTIAKSVEFIAGGINLSNSYHKILRPVAPRRYFVGMEASF